MKKYFVDKYGQITGDGEPIHPRLYVRLPFVIAMQITIVLVFWALFSGRN